MQNEPPDLPRGRIIRRPLVQTRSANQHQEEAPETISMWYLWRVDVDPKVLLATFRSEEKADAYVEECRTRGLSVEKDSATITTGQAIRKRRRSMEKVKR